jgi:hypothetical protein
MLVPILDGQILTHRVWMEWQPILRSGGGSLGGRSYANAALRVRSLDCSKSAARSVQRRMADPRGALNTENRNLDCCRSPRRGLCDDDLHWIILPGILQGISPEGP